MLNLNILIGQTLNAGIEVNPIPSYPIISLYHIVTFILYLMLMVQNSQYDDHMTIRHVRQASCELA